MKRVTHTTFQGIPISIETPKGGTREWYNPDNGTSGQTKMSADYGYVRGAVKLAVDGDQLDAFLGPNRDSKRVFVVRQRKADTNTYDESKFIFGCNSEKEAKALYLRHYDSPDFFESMWELPIEAFKEHLMKAVTANMNPGGIDLYDLAQVESLIANVNSMNDNDLVVLMEEVWGPSTTNYSSNILNLIRAEMTGFLLDQRDLLQLSPTTAMTGEAPPTEELPHSSPSSMPSMLSVESEESLSHEENYSDADSTSEQSSISETQDFSTRPESEPAEPTQSSPEESSSDDADPPDFAADEEEAIKAIQNEALESFCKAVSGPQPYDKLSGHKYSHREGDEIGRFFYTDDRGNYIRYTNAPEDHPDYDPIAGPPMLHDSEPPFESNPQYYTVDGRKLNRAPFPGAEVQWNPNYHPSDSKNLWAGRWVNPVTGEHEYTYIDADLRSNDKLRINRQNALVDVRLPEFRNYVGMLFRAGNIKDATLALMLALIDQARFRVMELCALSPSQVIFDNGVIRLGNRVILADDWVVKILQMLLQNRQPNEPLFVVPKGGADFNLAYRIGPHTVMRLMESMGLPVEAMQTYHASELYSRTMSRLLSTHAVSFEDAEMASLLQVALDMGVDLSQSDDYQTALQVIKENMVDPVVAEALAVNTQDIQQGPVPFDLASALNPPVYYVTIHLTGKTPEEEEFGSWIHNHPAHLHA